MFYNCKTILNYPLPEQLFNQFVLFIYNHLFIVFVNLYTRRGNLENNKDNFLAEKLKINMQKSDAHTKKNIKFGVTF